jgi:hypothetical protein
MMLFVFFIYIHYSEYGKCSFSILMFILVTGAAKDIEGWTQSTSGFTGLE